MNGYTITNIDPVSNMVSMDMVYGDYSKSVSQILDDISTADAVSSECDSIYSQFQSDIDNLPVLADDVADLIGTQQTQKTVQTNIAKLKLN